MTASGARISNARVVVGRGLRPRGADRLRYSSTRTAIRGAASRGSRLEPDASRPRASPWRARRARCWVPSRAGSPTASAARAHPHRHDRARCRLHALQPHQLARHLFRHLLRDGGGGGARRLPSHHGGHCELVPPAAGAGALLLLGGYGHGRPHDAAGGGGDAAGGLAVDRLPLRRAHHRGGLAAGPAHPSPARGPWMARGRRADAPSPRWPPRACRRREFHCRSGHAHRASGYLRRPRLRTARRLRGDGATWWCTSRRLGISRAQAAWRGVVDHHDHPIAGQLSGGWAGDRFSKARHRGGCMVGHAPR